MDELETRSEEWVRRGIYDDPKLSQIINMYEEIGFTVRVEPFKPGMEPGCIECIKENPDKYKVLYTKRNGPEREDRY